MSKVPSLSYDRIIRALQRDGWVVVRQKGSHIRLQKHTPSETLKLTIPVHRPVKQSTHATARTTRPLKLQRKKQHPRPETPIHDLTHVLQLCHNAPYENSSHTRANRTTGEDSGGRSASESRNQPDGCDPHLLPPNHSPTRTTVRRFDS